MKDRSAFCVAALSIIWLATSLGCSAESRSVAIGEAEVQVRSLWKTHLATASPDPRTGRPRDWQLHFTTWLPGEWPPTPSTSWTRYAYGLDVTMDGAAGVSAPFLRIERTPGDPKTAMLVPMTQRLESVAIHPVRPAPGWRYSLDDEKSVLAATLALTSAPPPQAPATRALIAYYRSWRASHSAITSLVESRHRAFFRWLDASQ